MEINLKITEQELAAARVAIGVTVNEVKKYLTSENEYLTVLESLYKKLKELP